MAIHLPDFTEFEPFNKLREKMNASELGAFELFDPKHHLTGDERSLLQRQGAELPRSGVSHLLDFTLVYKNTRCIVRDKSVFHVAHCEQFPIDDSLFVATNITVNMPKQVCPDCLKIIHYKGYDPLKARKEAYSQQVLQNFTLSEFWRHYALYPVSEKREIRKSIS
ncbi:hypothetical protein QWZ13_15465 [Reinekea marina]|uniref:Uncharacterized protein n=1 Tax=Reinekea marina TaxID=1310421 RepID=A0ABV7WTM6_9GAMM|nr:hypothetical protein [Reinekea marina]MDN3650307.1 hypothetical protein [Reinekea marina]